jgi:hypothetical protein
MSEQKKNNPDHSLSNAKIPASGEPPKVYAVSDLRALVKPELDEELGAPTGSLATCGTETLCTCVPVETCACNVVSYRQGGSACPDHCPCQCTSTGLYWFPY